jgi:hypothetical protein
MALIHKHNTKTKLNGCYSDTMKTKKLNILQKKHRGIQKNMPIKDILIRKDLLMTVVELLIACDY